MSFLEGIVEKVGVACGMDPEDAEKLGDIASAGANLAMGNYAGAAADGLDLFDAADDVPWLAAALEMYGMYGGQPGALPPGAGPAGDSPMEAAAAAGLLGEFEITLSFPIPA